MPSSKFGLLISKTTNLGDEIQDLAAAQFLPHIDYYVNRDNMSTAKNKGNILIILNGYFLERPYGNLHTREYLKKWSYDFYGWITGKTYDWPPPNNIHPLIISFYARYDGIVTRYRDYYKRFEPIGCRDYHTLELFKSQNIEAYFSGCLTLTFNNDYIGRREGVYFVDPFGWSGRYVFSFPGERGFRNDLWDKFPLEIRKKAIWLTHSCNEKNYTIRINKAKELLKIYSRAELVVTSRLHCALPCLALGTPVIFLYKTPDDLRFSGLVELLRRFSFKNILSGDFSINWKYPEPNPLDISGLADDLKRRCKEFIHK